jgi:hypothetical protein
MSAIDLAKLRSRTLRLTDLLEDPATFRTELRSLMEENAHRLLRRGPSMALHGALPAWEVPALLVREVEAAVVSAVQSKPSAALPLAKTLWNGGRLEEKQIAASLLELSPLQIENRALLAEWVVGLEDPMLLGKLAGSVCRPMWNADPVLFRSDLRRWMEADPPNIRRFGWMALHAWLAGGDPSQSAFAAFELLPKAFSEKDSEALQTGVKIFALLGRVFPQETRKWTEDLSAQAVFQGRSFFDLAISALPAELADLIRTERKKRPGGSAADG